eukprot:3300481-Amphidinium_carterae.1
MAIMHGIEVIGLVWLGQPFVVFLLALPTPSVICRDVRILLLSQTSWFCLPDVPVRRKQRSVVVKLEV